MYLLVSHMFQNLFKTSVGIILYKSYWLQWDRAKNVVLNNIMQAPRKQFLLSSILPVSLIYCYLQNLVSLIELGLVHHLESARDHKQQ